MSTASLCNGCIFQLISFLALTWRTCSHRDVVEELVRGLLNCLCEGSSIKDNDKASPDVDVEDSHQRKENPKSGLDSDKKQTGQDEQPAGVRSA